MSVKERNEEIERVRQLIHANVRGFAGAGEVRRGLAHLINLIDKLTK